MVLLSTAGSFTTLFHRKVADMKPLIEKTSALYKRRLVKAIKDSEIDNFRDGYSRSICASRRAV